jgi:hypothetical protein
MSLHFSTCMHVDSGLEVLLLGIMKSKLKK